MIAGAAIALSAAVLVSPSSPRRRLAETTKRPHVRWAWLAVPLSTIGVVLLPLTTVLPCSVGATTWYLRHRRRRRSERTKDESRQLETAPDSAPTSSPGCAVS